MVVGVNDLAGITVKPMVWIEVPHVTWNGGKALSSRPSIPGVPDDEGYGAFFPNQPKPVVSPLHLKHFAKNLAGSGYRLIVKKIRWSKAKYPEIEMTLPKSIETAFLLGAEYIGEFEAKMPPPSNVTAEQPIDDYALSKKYFKDMKIGELKYRASLVRIKFSKSTKKETFVTQLSEKTGKAFVEL